jgi:hypothetical protein
MTRFLIIDQNQIEFRSPAGWFCRADQVQFESVAGGGPVRRRVFATLRSKHTMRKFCRGRLVGYALIAICLAGCSTALEQNADEVLEQPSMPVPLADGERLGDVDRNLLPLNFHSAITWRR